VVIVIDTTMVIDEKPCRLEKPAPPMEIGPVTIVVVTEINTVAPLGNPEVDPPDVVVVVVVVVSFVKGPGNPALEPPLAPEPPPPDVPVTITGRVGEVEV
jgi:hypothetical protein